MDDFFERDDTTIPAGNTSFFTKSFGAEGWFSEKDIVLLH